MASFVRFGLRMVLCETRDFRTVDEIVVGFIDFRGGPLMVFSCSLSSFHKLFENACSKESVDINVSTFRKLGRDKPYLSKRQLGTRSNLVTWNDVS